MKVFIVIKFFWVWAPCGLAGRSQRFGEDVRIPFLPPYIIPLIPSMVTSALKMETVCFSEKLASTRQSTRRPNPEEHHQYRHRCENLKSQKGFMFVKYSKTQVFSRQCSREANLCGMVRPNLTVGAPDSSAWVRARKETRCIIATAMFGNTVLQTGVLILFTIMQCNVTDPLQD
jgi:hypothetical protein